MNSDTPANSVEAGFVYLQLKTDQAFVTLESAVALVRGETQDCAHFAVDSIPCPIEPEQSTLLQALVKLQRSNRLAINFVVSSVACNSCTVRASLFFPIELWSCPSAWKKGPAAAEVFRSMQCCYITERSAPTSSEAGTGPSRNASSSSSAPCQRNGAPAPPDASPGLDRPLEGTPRAAFTLSSCFKELPTCNKDPPLPPLLPASLSLGSHAVSLHLLPHEVITRVLAQLSAQDLAMVACTCSYLRSVAGDSVPDLKLSLYPHQVSYHHLTCVSC